MKTCLLLSAVHGTWGGGVGSHSPPSVSQLMVALNSLQTIYVRGSYGPSPQSQARLQAVTLETTQVPAPRLEDDLAKLVYLKKMY
jgi:hypothetical protein